MTISTKAIEITLATGGRVVILPTSVQDVVSIKGSIIGGPSAFKASLDIAAELSADLLDAGAGKLKKEAFRSGLAGRGAELSFDVSDTRLSFSASCFPEDIEFVIARIADALFAPHLPASDFATSKVSLQADLDEEATTTRSQAERALTRLIYPSNHPNHSLSIDALKKAAKAAALPQVKEIVSQYGTKNLALAVVGDINAKQVKRIQETIENAFGKARAGAARPVFTPVSTLNRPDPKREGITIAGKASSDTAIGAALGFGIEDERYLPTALVTHLLGGGFAAHLMQTVRERDGLTYGVSARLRGMADMLDAYLQIWGTFAPELLARGTETLTRETHNFLKDGVTAERLAEGKEEIAGAYAISLATTYGLAARLVRIMEDDRSLSWIDKYPDYIREITLEEAQEAAAFLASLPLSIATAGSV